MTARGIPSSADQTVAQLHGAFQDVVGVDLDEPGVDEPVYLERFGHGGMSSGQVDLEVWRERLMPMLVGRVRDSFEHAQAELQQAFAVFEPLVRPFAQAIHAKAIMLGEVTLSGPQQARVLESMSDDLRKCSDILVPDVRPPEVSQMASGHAYEIDLRAQTWHTQPAFDPGRKVFMFDHVTPINALRARCQSAATSDEIVGCLWREMRVAWVLKTENAKLNELGYGNHRPLPLAAYAQAGILLV